MASSPSITRGDPVNGGDEATSQLLNFLGTESENARDTTLDDKRAAFLDAYFGALYGDEQDGRSQAVTRDVSEVVDYMTTGILGSVMAGGKAVEFESEPEQVPATGPDGQPQINPQTQQPVMQEMDYGAQATKSVQYQFFSKQRGYFILHDAIKAALIEMTGVVRTYAEPRRPIRQQVQAPGGLIEQDGEGNATLDGHRVVGAEPADDPEHDAMTVQAVLTGMPAPEMGARLHTITIEVPQAPIIRDEAIPNEWFLVSPDTVDLDTSPYVGQCVPTTLSTLVGMGFDPERLKTIWDNAPAEIIVSQTRDRDRSKDRQSIGQRPGAARQLWLYTEYPLWDLDGDGIAERLCVMRIGRDVLSVTQVDEQPYSGGSPIPMQFRFTGQGMADKTADIQRVRTVLLRSALNSLYLSTMPRTLVHEDSISENTIDDLLTPNPGALIRWKGAQQPTPLAVQDTSATAFQAMEMMSSERDSRTSVTRQSQGLNPDAMNKMLCIETPVPMSDGSFKKLGDIQDGDRVIGSSGSAVTVAKAHKIHLPDRAYRITFYSGEVILSGGEHLWTFQDDDDRWKKGNRWRTRDTDYLYKRFSRMKGNRAIYIPRVARPQIENAQSAPLDPYILGAWLGDGSASRGCITSMDAEIVDAFRDWTDGEVAPTKNQNSGKALTYKVDDLAPALRAIGVINNKHIPEVYFHTSREDRLNLLRGLMDTDGCAAAGSRAVFCQKDGRLLADVFRLVESLGGWPKLKKLNIADGAAFEHIGDHYHMAFTLPDNPFRMTRKAEKFTATPRNEVTQAIINIEPIDIRPMRCLTVDAEDGLFCVGKRFTVTHNTASGMAMLQQNASQMGLYVTRNLVEAIIAPMFAKRYRLMKAHGEPFRMKVDGSYVTVDPTKWPDEIDIAINVGIGTGTKDQRIAYRDKLLQYAQIAMSGGLRVFSEEQIGNMLADQCSDMGLSENRYVQDVSKLPPPEPKPDPETIKAQADAQTKQQANDQAHQQAVIRLQLQEREQQANAALKQQANEQDLAAKREKSSLDIELARQKAVAETALAERQQTFEMGLAERRFAFDQEQARKKHEQAAQTDDNLTSYRDGGSLDA